MFDEGTPDPSDMRDGAVVDQSNSDNGGTLAGDSSASNEGGTGSGRVNVEVTRG